METQQAGRPHRAQARIGENGNTWIEGLRVDYDVDRADVIRTALAVAATHNDEVRARLRILKENR